jgi:outer membrane beta-barrel protein
MIKKIIFSVMMLILTTPQVHASEDSLYDFLWLDPDKKVYVLQNKLFKKEGKIYGDLGYLSNFTSTFQKTSGVSGKLGYYIHEEWGIEGYYNFYQNEDNENWKNVRSVNGADPFVRRLNSSYGAMVIWSPFYGKINTFNKIVYFDWSFGLGVGLIDAESNRKTVDDTNLKSGYEKERYQSVAWKTKVKFHLNENVHLGVEWMQQHYKAPGPNRNGQSASETFKNNQDLIISVGFSY